MTAPLFLAQPPRFLFFTGKGGVGKTSLACASAVRLADAGRRVLLVSTDPASNIAQVFGIASGNRVTAVEGVPGLAALEIDPQAAAQGYRDRIVNPVRGLLPDDVVKGIEEQLSGACTTEIAAFDEFTALLTDDGRIRQFDHVVFDTAPTGHTIRLLQLPGAWDQFLEAGKGDASCLGPLAGLEKQRSRYHEAVLTLADPARTRLVLVARAQRTALAEADRTARELRASGVGTQFLAVNGRHRPPPGPGAAGGCHRGRRQGLRDAHGQGGRGQDDRGRRDRRGTGEARLPGAPEHLGSGGAPVADAGGSRGQPHRQPHRPARGDGQLPRARPAHQGASLDEAGRALLEEDLRSPCTEEIAVFQAFSRVVRESARKFVGQRQPRCQRAPLPAAQAPRLRRVARNRDHRIEARRARGRGAHAGGRTDRRRAPAAAVPRLRGCGAG